MNLLKKFAADESGATAIEYGLIAALVSVAIIVAIGLLGDGLSETFENIAACLGQGEGTCPGTTPVDP